MEFNYVTAYIEYIDGEVVIKGNFTLDKIGDNYIIFSSKKNQIILPMHKLNKIKLKGGNKI